MDQAVLYDSLLLSLCKRWAFRLLSRKEGSQAGGFAIFFVVCSSHGHYVQEARPGGLGKSVLSPPTVLYTSYHASKFRWWHAHILWRIRELDGCYSTNPHRFSSRLWIGTKSNKVMFICWWWECGLCPVSCRQIRYNTGIPAGKISRASSHASQAKTLGLSAALGQIQIKNQFVDSQETFFRRAFTVTPVCPVWNF